jgi:hypothetical protein
MAASEALHIRGGGVLRKGVALSIVNTSLSAYRARKPFCIC